MSFVWVVTLYTDYRKENTFCPVAAFATKEEAIAYAGRYLPTMPILEETDEWKEWEKKRSATDAIGDEADGDDDDDGPPSLEDTEAWWEWTHRDHEANVQHRPSKSLVLDKPACTSEQCKKENRAGGWVSVTKVPMAPQGTSWPRLSW